jgi:hypothetical protein
MTWRDDLLASSQINTPDSFLNEPTRLSGIAVQKLSYFSKVSMSPDFEKKISTTAG